MKGYITNAVLIADTCYCQLGFWRLDHRRIYGDNVTVLAHGRIQPLPKGFHHVQHCVTFNILKSFNLK